jgi:hypothetical protein
LASIRQWERADQLSSQLRNIARQCVESKCGFRCAAKMFKAALMEELLIVHNNNQLVVAGITGLHRNTIGRLVKEHGIRPGWVQRRDRKPNREES